MLVYIHVVISHARVHLLERNVIGEFLVEIRVSSRRMRRESDGLLTFDGFPFSMEQKPGRDEKFAGRDKMKDRSDANRV